MSQPLTNTFVRSVPDLVFIVRRDGLIEANLGGSDAGVTEGPGDLAGTTLRDTWAPEVAGYIHELIRRTLKSRSPSAGRCDHRGTAYDVRVLPKGIDRALVVLRTMWGAAPDDGDSGSPHESAQSSCLQTRSAFADVLSTAVIDARLREMPFAVAAAHLGGLREVSDAAGSTVAERLIHGIVARLEIEREDRQSPIRSFGSWARLEWDTLAAILPGAGDRATMESAAERLRQICAESAELDGHSYLLTPTVGIALFPTDGERPEALLDNVSDTISRARRTGRQNVVAFHSTAPKNSAGTAQDLTRELAWAAERDQFVLRYQPIVELAGQRTMALEATIEWHHPVRGAVAATEFLPIAETTALGGEIHRWMLRRACLDIARLDEQGRKQCRVAIHPGRQLLVSRTLTEDITGAAETAGVNVGRLDLLIPEGLLCSSERALEHLAALRSRGVRIFVDGFGSGGLSLGALPSLPIDGLRIDVSFISRLESDAGARAACRSAIAIAKAFSLRSVAIAVATPTQRDWLRQADCHEAQGPLFGAVDLTEGL